KFDPKTKEFRSWGAPDFLKRNEARIAMVMPEQTHVDGKVWIGADNEYQVDMATGEWTEIDYRKMQPPGAKDHGSYGVAADSKNDFYGLELNADYIIKVDAKTLSPRTTRRRPRIPARGAAISTIRIACGLQRIAATESGCSTPRRRDFRSGSCPPPSRCPMTRSSTTAPMPGRAVWATIMCRGSMPRPERSSIICSRPKRTSVAWM